MNLLNSLNVVTDPLSKNMHLVILGLYAYVLMTKVKDNEYMTMIVLTVATCMAICYLQKGRVVEGSHCHCGDTDSPHRDGFENSCSRETPPEGFQNKPIKKRRVRKEGFENAPGSAIVSQVPDVMGAYDGLCLQTGNRQHWMKTPDETALVPNEALFTFLSSQGPTKPVFTDNSALTGPPVDGHPDSAKKMFMFANNRSSPNCCPSTFSTSTGCVCTTKNQRDFVASRGGAVAPANLEDM